MLLDSSEQRETEHRVQRDIVDACVEHYEVFNVANSALRQASTAGGLRASEIDQRLSASLASLDGMSKRMLGESTAWRGRRQVAINAVSQSYRVVELLEAPQTLEACLATEAFHEALLVVDHVRSMRIEFPQSLLLAAVSERVDQVLADGLASVVFPKLAQSISLTACIKLITLLRRLGVPDHEIRHLYLSRKMVALELAIGDATRIGQSTYSLLSKAISVFKVAVTEIVLRYEACFCLDDDGHVDELQSWVHRRSGEFGELFRQHLRVITSGAELASLGSQLEHLAPSMGKVSMDLTTMLVPLVAERAFELFANHLRMTKETYTAAMGAQTWGASSTSHQKNGTDAGVPMQLLHYLPLAYIVNGILTGCNEIRKCAFSSMGTRSFDLVEELLIGAARDVVSLKCNRFLSQCERSSLTEYSQLLESVLLPHVEESLQKVFPGVGERRFEGPRRCLCGM